MRFSWRVELWTVNVNAKSSTFHQEQYHPQPHMADIEKATYPTTRQRIACDYFDKVLDTGLHQTEDGEVKVNIKLDGEVSLYQEDVAMLITHLTYLQQFARPRLERTAPLKKA